MSLIEEEKGHPNDEIRLEETNRNDITVDNEILQDNSHNTSINSLVNNLNNRHFNYPRSNHVSFNSFDKRSKGVTSAKLSSFNDSIDFSQKNHCRLKADDIHFNIPQQDYFEPGSFNRSNRSHSLKSFSMGRDSFI